MTRYIAFKAGLAGIALFLSIIVVVSEDVPSTGSPTFNTTANSTQTGDDHVTTFNRTEFIPAAETTQSTKLKTPIVQLSETDQQMEELLLTTQNHSANVEDEGSGEEPFVVPSSDEFAVNTSTAQSPEETTTATTTWAVTEVTESERTTSLPVVTEATFVDKAPHDLSENSSMITSASTNIFVPGTITTEMVSNQSEDVMPEVPMVIPETTTETTIAESNTETPDNQEMKTAKAPETTTTGVRFITESASTEQLEVSTTVQSSTTSLFTASGPVLINGTHETRSMGNFSNKALELDNQTTETASTTASPVPSVSHAPLGTSKVETDEHTTYASSIVEHYVTTEETLRTTIPEPVTMTQQSSLTIGAINVSLMTEATPREHSITNKTESAIESSTTSVKTPGMESTTRVTEKSPGTSAPILTQSGPMEQQNETKLELSTYVSISATDFQAPVATEISTEMTAQPQSKCYDKLSEPEFFNSVTAVFTRPPKMKGMLFDRETFKETVICLINTYELQGWPLTLVNVSDCDEFNNTLESKLLTATDLVIIEPSPTLNNNEIIVSFFTRNTTAKYSGQIVSRNRTLRVLNNHKEYVMNQMGMNITDIYGGMRLSHLVTPTMDPFYMRHSLLLIILAVVAGVCILIIISGLIYIKCRATRSKWSSTSSYIQEKSKLQRDMLCSEMGQHLNSDDDINKDETLRVMNNGNGFFAADTGSGSSVTPIGDEDGWVIPYDELSPEEKSSVDVEDTKL